MFPAATIPAAFRAHPGVASIGHPALPPVGRPTLVAVVFRLFPALGGRDFGREHPFLVLVANFGLFGFLLVLLGRGPFPLRVSRLVGRSFLGFFFLILLLVR